MIHERENLFLSVAWNVYSRNLPTSFILIFELRLLQRLIKKWFYYFTIYLSHLSGQIVLAHIPFKRWVRSIFVSLSEWLYGVTRVKNCSVSSLTTFFQFLCALPHRKKTKNNLRGTKQTGRNFGLQKTIKIETISPVLEDNSCDGKFIHSAKKQFPILMYLDVY